MKNPVDPMLGFGRIQSVSKKYKNATLPISKNDLTVVLLAGENRATQVNTIL